jgi:hypothetical protein
MTNKIQSIIESSDLDGINLQRAFLSRYIPREDWHNASASLNGIRRQGQLRLLADIREMITSIWAYTPNDPMIAMLVGQSLINRQAVLEILSLPETSDKEI